MQDYDVIIVGGAIIGSSTAWFLSRNGCFDGRILVVEKDPGYQKCSTALSLSCIRQQFSTPLNIHISQFGVDFLRTLQQQDRGGCAFNLVERGYLLLASHRGVQTMRDNTRLQLAHGADTRLFEPDELAGRFPWLSVDGVALASLGMSGEGWFDAYSLMQYFRQGARDNGTTYVQGEVTGLDLVSGRVAGVRLADGRQFSCDHLVNAAGTGAADVSAMAGIEIDIQSRKRCVFVIDSSERESITDCPHLIDYSGVYIRPEGQYFITGTSPPVDADLPCSDFDVDYDLFYERVWPVLAQRIPALEAVKVVSAWAGHYAYNPLDQNAVIGPHPVIGNFFFANGFSGHGVQQAPAVGRAIAEYIMHGRYVSLDLSELGFTRILEGRKVIEQNVF